MTDDRIAELRTMGIMLQKDRDYFLIRIGVCGGKVTPELLSKSSDLADCYSGSTMHLTTRQTIEIHNIHKDDIEEAVQKMRELDMPFAASGARLRTVVACPGDPVCRFSRGDTQGMAQAIRKNYQDFAGLNCKVKISVTGCVNSCAKPQENDIGLMAAGDDNWRIFVGGKIGRKPMLGRMLFKADSQSGALEIIGNILNWHKDNGQKKERVASALERLGEKSLTGVISNL